jgi:hypothetical protein
MGFRITNLEIIGSGCETNNGSGIVFENDLTGDLKLPFVLIDHVKISGFGECGILIDGNNRKSGFKDVRITHVEVHDNALTGIYVRGEFAKHARDYAHADVYVGYARAYGNCGISGTHREHSGSGIIMSDVNGGMIERCVAFENGLRCEAQVGGAVGIWAWDSNAIILQHNEAYRNRTAGTKDGGGFDLDGGVTNSVMRYNYSHDNDGAGFFLAQFPGARPFTENRVHHNISENDGRKNGYGGIRVWGDVRDSDIFNNTVYAAPARDGSPSAISFVDDLQTSSGIRVRNNIFYTTEGVPLVDVATDRHEVLFQGNNYFSGPGQFRINWCGTLYKSLDAWRIGTKQERQGTVNSGRGIDPTLQAVGQGGTLNNANLLESLDAYRLRADSPMIDSGCDIRKRRGPSADERDFFGTELPQGRGFDVGAHEFD